MAEYVGVICFLFVRSKAYPNKFLAYVIDNSDVVTWIKYIRPNIREVQYFVRNLNRFETERNFAVFPWYISHGNNEFFDYLPRFHIDPIRQYAYYDGYSYIDVLTMFQWHLTDRIRTRPTVLPTDPAERVQTITQFVEKRIARHIPTSVGQLRQLFWLGTGVNSRKPVLTVIHQQQLKGPILLNLPSVKADGQDTISVHNRAMRCVIFTLPAKAKDMNFAFGLRRM